MFLCAFGLVASPSMMAVGMEGINPVISDNFLFGQMTSQVLVLRGRSNEASDWPCILKTHLKVRFS